MQLEEYFEFCSENDIRLKGTRVGIESILYEYIYKQRSPEEIIKHFSGISMEQIYATILYYLHNQEAVNQYITDSTICQSSIFDESFSIFDSHYRPASIEVSPAKRR